MAHFKARLPFELAAATHAAAEMGVFYNTAKRYLDEMTRRGVATPLASAPAATYYSPEAMRIVYASPA